MKEFNGRLMIKRIYAKDIPQGCRILADRLWPRGIRKEEANIDLWARELAPSSELRKWYSHIPERYDTFALRYREELNSNPDAEVLIQYCQEQLVNRDVILLYAAKDEERNNAAVLCRWLNDALKKEV